ncbi:PrsW family intramembrane metalloprotease [Spirillospora sp. NPDC127200]
MTATAPVRPPASPDPTTGAAIVVFAAGCAVGVVSLYLLLLPGLRVFPGAVAFAAVLQLAVLVVGWALLRLMRPVHAPPPVPSLLGPLWGAVAAIGCAVPANDALLSLWAKLTTVDFASSWGAALTAPLNEELLKLAGVALLALVFPGALRGPLDGLILGALTGLGFQVVENVSYSVNLIVQSGATAPTTSVVQTFVARVVLTGPGSHWAMSAVAGAGLGHLVAGRRHLAAPLVSAAVAMHWLFDAPLLSASAAPLIKVAVNFLAFAAAYFLLRRAYRIRARRVLTQASSLREAGVLLTRYRRREAVQQAPPGPARTALAARQRALLALID